jgi:GDPmannose 4,6-dehydratase
MQLGWQPRIGFEELIDMMIAADMEISKKEKTLRDAGYEVAFNHRM